MDTLLAPDPLELQTKVRQMYRAVAERPHERYHFETGRGLAERLGYVPALLDVLPAQAVESFAGVGYFFDLAELRAGERVLDLGSGSGTDSFAAALQVGREGLVVGIDMTREQLAKAERLRADAGFSQVRFVYGQIEELPFADGSFDVVISNGVINLSPNKPVVFQEAARVLLPAGRLVVADIVTRVPLSEQIVCKADLWASCIGGAAQLDTYRGYISSVGFKLDVTRVNEYEFISDRARRASMTYGLTSLSLLGRRQ